MEEEDRFPRSRGWTRSQSPLRQLLSNSASGARSVSPKHGFRPSQVRVDRGDQEAPCVITPSHHPMVEGGKLTTASAKKAGKEKEGEGDADGQGATITTTAAVVVSDVPVNDGELAIPESGDLQQQEQQQQQQQQQQSRGVCAKGLLHPVSYDECHIPSDQDDDLRPAGPAMVIPAATAVCASSSSNDNDDDNNDNDDNDNDNNDGSNSTNGDNNSNNGTDSNNSDNTNNDADVLAVHPTE